MMNDLPGSRAGESTALEAGIKVLREKLTVAAGDLAKWKIEFEVDVIPGSLDLKITARKPFGGGGIIKTIPRETVLYYMNDVASLIDMVTEQVYEHLLKELIKEELTEKISRRVTNIRVMIGKKL